MKIIENKSGINDYKLLVTVMISMLTISIVIAISVFGDNGSAISELEGTLYFIKLFNIIVSILGVGSCFVLYKRSNDDGIFFIFLMYISLSVAIMFDHIDYLQFYVSEFNLQTYIVISASLLRIFLLVLSVNNNSKFRKVVIRHKVESTIIVIAITVMCGFIERNVMTLDLGNDYFILFNMILTVINLITSTKLVYYGVKHNNYLYIVLSSSMFLLAVKSIYAIYILENLYFYTKLMSVMLTYMSFFIIIIGALIELLIYNKKTETLNENLNLFYTLADNSKYSYMLIYDKDENLVYANEKAFGKHSKSERKMKLKELDKTIKSRAVTINNGKISGNDGKILKQLEESGYWRGVINNKETGKTMDCCVQLIDQYIVATYIDITETMKKDLEVRKLKDYDKTKTEFIANLSHEIKTPLNLFYSSIQLLDNFYSKENINFREVYGRYKKILETNCKRMTRLVNNIIDLSKMDLGVVKVDFRNYEIVSLIEEVTLSVVDYSESLGIRIEFDTNEEEKIIKCEASMIERVILNLLSNAIKFSKDTSNIFVNLHIDEEWIVIEVKDEGIGISKEHQDIVFEKYIQIDKSFTRENEGSGIGLSIVKSIVNLHEGKITIDSELGKGTTFKVYLPNVRLGSEEVKIYDINRYNTKLELSDIYELLGDLSESK